MPHVLITPRTAGGTQRYEDNVIEILGDIWGGDERLRNDVV
jgi:hypothetical protein